ncbi:MAG: LysM peptidoglycan-binding domain-containing protein [Bacillota bacterium]|nr:LysM peptidoglycan-binding domain-containing protein [Bacillota bacterium]MDD3297259.1 LysM peptidoglycan-binding domain-containing protein [Bacillota bacterium]MDD3850477.1 LysM peptidoglycan-binding domain-containing protein [Bacillota bacterium]MDD4708030.1 LysM peptidoglycan-binding domain-containing protein [Bacillota bacterium]
MKRITGVLIVIISVSMMSFLGSLALGASARAEEEICMEYIVKSGDTLWAIAKKHTSGKSDIRRYIYDIMDKNGMESPDIMPGQVLFIPPER